MFWMYWTIRISMLVYAASFAARTSGRFTAWRVLWTSSWALLCVHVALAFHHVHDWSHADAVTKTAEDTAAVVGLDWGGGVWLNYALLALWGGDVVWSWTSRESYGARGVWIDRSVHVFIAFMAISATIVFEEGVVRWIGVAAFLLLAFHARRCHTAEPNPSGDDTQIEDMSDEEPRQGGSQKR